MMDPKKPSDPQKSSEPSEPKKGGFGAFAQRYRDRWAADHPQAGTANGTGDRPEPSTKPDASDPDTDREGRD